MKEVGTWERAADPAAVSSAYSPWLDSSPDDRKRLCYKPCHYFDYIGGSGAGGLGAIMLGRLRMSMEATMREYENLSAQVFKKPSSWLKRSFGARMSATKRESVRKMLGSRTPEQPSLDEDHDQFRSDSLRRKTIVCSSKSSRKENFKQPFLFRTYDCGSRSCSPDERKLGSASGFDIQTVANATLGGPSCLKPFEARKCRYYDDAIDLGNPSWQLYNEVKFLTRGTEKSISLLLSIGGRNCQNNHPKDGISDQSSQRDFSEISEHIEKTLTKESERRNFGYYRLDVDQALQDADSSEWQPKKLGKTTLRQIVDASRHYLETEEVRSKLRECAQELVRIRRLRAQTMRWEAFATGVSYNCPISSCRYEKKLFEARIELLDHLQIDHGKPPPDVQHYQEIQELLDAGRIGSI